ncbi:MAG: hypothetical protein LBS92_06185 [Candidatus Methanoplasma sp.]|jgi:hypothetical protein|nr:hypothetical protein [Candidatus Methanoplasma sp.]
MNARKRTRSYELSIEAVKALDDVSVEDAGHTKSELVSIAILAKYGPARHLQGRR